MLYAPNISLDTLSSVATDIGKEIVSDVYDTASYYTPQFLKNIAEKAAIGGVVGFVAPIAVISVAGRAAGPGMAEISLVGGALGAAYGLYKGAKQEIFRQAPAENAQTNNCGVQSRLKP